MQIRNQFLQGTIVLAWAGLLAKLLASSLSIVLAHTIGDTGLGILATATPVFVFALAITGSGIPIALSKQVAEIRAQQPAHHDLSPLLSAALWMSLLGSLTFILLALLGLPALADRQFIDQRIIASLYAILPTLLILSFSAVYRGYFQGVQNMRPYAISFILEQSSRVVVAWLLASWLLPYGIAWAAAGAMTGTTVGEFCSLWYLRRTFRRQYDWRLWGSAKGEVRKAFVALWHHVLPITGGRSVGALAYAAQPFVVEMSFLMAGVSIATATALYGRLTGMAAQLLMGPAFLTYALSVALVPAISEAVARRQQGLVVHRVRQAIRLSLVVGMPCFILLLALAKPIALLLYPAAYAEDIAHFLQILAIPFGLTHYLQGPFVAMAQALGAASVTLRNTLVSAAIKLGLIVLLVAYQGLGIDGVALAMCFGGLLTLGLHALSLTRLLPDFSWPWGRGAQCFLLSLAMYAVTRSYDLMLPHPLRLFGVILASLLVYLLLAWKMQLIRRSDVQSLLARRRRPKVA